MWDCFYSRAWVHLAGNTKGWGSLVCMLSRQELRKLRKNEFFFFFFLIDQSTAVTEPYKHNNAGTRVSISIQQSSAAHRFSCPEKLLTTDEIPTN